MFLTAFLILPNHAAKSKLCINIAIITSDTDALRLSAHPSGRAFLSVILYPLFKNDLRPSKLAQRTS
jgi:hypothetical protein